MFHIQHISIHFWIMINQNNVWSQDYFDHLTIVAHGMLKTFNYWYLHRIAISERHVNWIWSCFCFLWVWMMWVGSLQVCWNLYFLCKHQRRNDKIYLVMLIKLHPKAHYLCHIWLMNVKKITIKSKNGKLVSH